MAGTIRTPYQKLKADWIDCTRCPLHECRSNRVVIARGSVPADILIVGEAPGESEDTIGKPFVGPAGHLLDFILKKAVPEAGKGVVTYLITNVVGCIPRYEDGAKASEPEHEHVMTCLPRVEGLARLCGKKLKLVVSVGKTAESYMLPGFKHSADIDESIPRLTLTHPAAILRANVVMRDLMINQQVVRLKTAVHKHITS